jgi:hypothetical protein
MPGEEPIPITSASKETRISRTPAVNMSKLIVFEDMGNS